METVTLQEKASKPFSLTFELTIMPITLNEVISSRWKDRHSNFKAVKQLIHLLTLKTKPKKPIQKARVRLTRYSSGTLDRDNMYFTFKPIIDGLVNAGIIIDDGFDQVKELYPEQVKIKRKEMPKCIVTVEEIQ